MASNKNVKLDVDKFMRVVFRIEKPCWMPVNEAVQIIHSDKKHGLKKWKYEDTQDTEYAGHNTFILETYLPVGGTLWFKLAVFRIVHDYNPHLLHVEEFNRRLELTGGARLVDMTYNEKKTNIKLSGHHYNVAVPIKNIGIFVPTAGGWNMTNDDLRPEQYHRAEYYGVDGTLRCRIIDPPRPKFAEMGKKLIAPDKEKPAADNTQAEPAVKTVQIEPEDVWESDEDKEKVSTRKQKKYKKKTQANNPWNYAKRLENLIVQYGNAILVNNRCPHPSSSSSVSTASSSSSTVKVQVPCDTQKDASPSDVLIASMEANKKVRSEPKASSSSEAYASAISDVNDSSSEAYMSAVSGVSVSSNVTAPRVAKCEIGTCTSLDDFMGEGLTSDANNNMADLSNTENDEADNRGLVKRYLKYAVPVGLAGAGIVGAFMLLRK